VAFDASFARDVVLPLAKAAYAVMDGSQPDLPSGFAQTTLIQADAAVLAAKTTPHPAVAAMTKNTNIFGLMGRSTARRTAFVSFRGTSDAPDWLADLDAIPAAYSRLPNFGQVHTGFQDVYDLVRASIAATWPPQPPAAIRSSSPDTASAQRWPCSRRRMSSETCRRTRSNPASSHSPARGSA
jgi:hypothetical protein